MPVRNASNRGRKNVIGKHPSLKMGRMIAFESLVELDYIYTLDYEKDITQFEEQPLTIEYPFGTKTLHYTPDFLFIRDGQHTLIECKPEKFTTTDENCRKFAAAERWCAEQDWRFEVVTAESLRAGHRLANIKFLTRFARYTVLPGIKGQIYDRLATAAAPLTILDLARQLNPQQPETALPAIFQLVFSHEIALPVNETLLSSTSVVTLPEVNQCLHIAL